MYTLKMPWISKAAIALRKAQKWLNENWLRDDHPASMTTRRYIPGLSRQQREYLVESDSNKLRARIAACKTMRELHEAEAVVERMQTAYGATEQVVAVMGSLRLAILQKGMEIGKTEEQ